MGKRDRRRSRLRGEERTKKPEPIPGPEPLSHFGGHVAEAWDDELWALRIGATEPRSAVLAPVTALVFGLLSFLGISRLVWRVTHRG